MKYSLPEIERRWLAITDKLPDLSTLPRALIEDKYLPNSRIRLRKLAEGDTVTYKLGKKYGKTSTIEEPITNIYLSEPEYRLFNTLPGTTLKRMRFYYNHHGRIYSINVGEQQEPVIVEAEYQTKEEAWRAQPPVFCGQEVTGNTEFEGKTLSERRPKDVSNFIRSVKRKHLGPKSTR